MATKKTIEEKIASALPLAVYQATVRRKVVTFVYHMVTPSPAAYIKNIYPSKTPAEFEQDLIYLKENFHLITYRDLLTEAEGRGELPKNACLVTLDDGYRECFTEARPLLKKHNIPCIFFLTTGFLDNQAMFYRNKYSLCLEVILAKTPLEAIAFQREVQTQFGQQFDDQAGLLAWLRRIKISEERILDELCEMLGIDVPGLLQAESPYLTHAQVRGLVEEGFTIGAHSVRHPKFIDLGPDEIREEIITSCEAISALTGKQHVPFAFPFSGAGIDRAWLQTLRRKNPVIGLFFETQGVRKEAPFVVNRIWADPPPGPKAASNLATLLHEAYQANAVWRREYYASMAAYKLGLKRD